MHPIWLLAFITFVAIIGFLVYTRISHRRMRVHGGQASGVGEQNDPIAGATQLERSPQEMIESLDAHSR